MSIVVQSFSYLLFYLNIAAMVVTLVLAVAGFIQVVTTRSDAFTVLDRQQQNWLLLLGGAVVGTLLSYQFGMQMLWIIAAVIVGIYWMDVRPSVKDVLGNAGGQW